jgi:phosphatidate cytidylyltransferase
VRARTLSALVIVPLVVVALLAGAVGIALLVLVLAALAGREVEALLRAAGRPVVAGGVAAGAVLLVVVAALPAVLGSQLLGRSEQPMKIAAAVGRIDGLAVVGIVAAALAAVALTRRDPAEGFAAWSSTAFGAVYVGFLGSVVLLAAGSGDPPSPEPVFWGERRWPLVLLGAVWAFDTGAFLVGRAVGRRRFFPWISAKKTLEGVAGGLVSATIAVGVILALSSHPWLEAMVIGPLVGAAAQAGDLAESMLKRAAGAKDSGALIPGHGGVLDRIDSFLLAAPVLAAYVALVHP